MELTAGLGSVDDYIRYIEAGADECFCGYIPYAWDRKYGTVLSLNRREVRCCSVQLGAFSELEILAAMVRAYQKPVQLTFNSLYYLPQQYPEIAEIIQKCMKIGFEDYIIADPALILYLRQQKIGCRISLSGEVGEINSAMAGLFEQMEISRIIFPRKMRPKDMAVVAQACAKRSPGLENMKYEAFALNELCQFSGAFCNSLHCDEMGYLCRVPYRVGVGKSQRKDSILIDHKEWTPDNGRNNALRINGLGAPRAFYTPVLRDIKVPNTSYGEDYALGLRISREYQIGRIYDSLYLCRRWDENSDASLDVVKMNGHNLYKDKIRTIELKARKKI